MRNAYRFPLIAAAALLLAGGSALAAENAGPEPYSAPDPHYAVPMQREPLVKPMSKEQVSLGSADDIKGPAAGPEP